MIFHGKRTSNEIALTFDDGPCAHTAEILKILGKYKIKATFFLIGQNVEKLPHVARKIIRQGHEIGMHTYSHQDLPESLFTANESEITKTEKTIKSMLHKETKLFRPTKGLAMKLLWSWRIWRAVKEKNLKVILASAYSRASRSAERQFSDITKNLRGGDIILLHDGDGTHVESGRWYEKTVKILPGIIKCAKSRNLKFVTVSELLGQKARQKHI
ncbi:MAG: polysaccharide deacetylase family protein [Candidatus Woesearchaeota archaeon]